MALSKSLLGLVTGAALALLPSLAFALPPGTPPVTRPPSALASGATRTSAVTPMTRTVAPRPTLPTTFSVLARSQAFNHGPALFTPAGHQFTSAGGKLAAASNPRDARGRFVAAPRESAGAAIVGGHPTATRDWSGQLRGASGAQHVTPMFDARSGRPLRSEAVSVNGRIGTYTSRARLEQLEAASRR